jgi:hypothetical protein
MMDTKYKNALAVCSAKLAGQDGSDPMEAALCFFRLGVALAHVGEIAEGIRCFNDAFMLRDSSGTPSEEGWRDFHDIHMTRYILGKRCKLIASLAEGDMIHDLIKHRWNDLQHEIAISSIPFAASSRHEWYKTVILDFPWSIDAVWDAQDTSGPDCESECVGITQ